MARSTVIFEGPGWQLPDESRRTELWGAIAPDDTVSVDQEATHGKLFDLWVERFEQLATEAGFQLAWVPESSVLLARPEDRERLDFPKVEEWRTQALEEVRSLWNSGGIALVCQTESAAD